MKISVIMQVYLGNYPGARSDPQYKFVRAVNSFLNQKHAEKELVIVADQCDDTKLLYERLFSHEPSIKFVYVAKGAARRMYEKDKNKKHFRGLPRQVGRALASGHVITYMDGDDIMLPSRLSDINTAWTAAPMTEVWSYNTLGIMPVLPDFAQATARSLDLRLYGYPIDQTVYAGLMVPPGKFLRSPWAICHRADVKSVWKDTFDVLDDAGNIIGGSSEDVAFVSGLQQESPGFRQDSPSYVICHSRDRWDI